MSPFKSTGRFCVLDDEKAFLSVAKGKLSKYLPNIQGHYFSDPEDVFKIASDEIQTLFIIDMNLGEYNGMDIYRKISEISTMNRVIFITGDTMFLEDEEIRKQTLSEGGIDFIEKPIKWSEMAIKIQNHLNLLEYQYELEGKVEERTQMLIHADRLATVGTMVSSIVHEISSPLTFIKANQETFLLAYNNAKDEITDPAATKIFDKFILPGVKDSLAGIERIEALLKSFRKFYKKEHRVTANDINTILNEVKHLAYYSIKRNRVDFTLDLEKDPDYTIKCNRQEIIQAITNIVNNAIDALEELDTGKRKIGIAVRKEGKYVTVRISNNGPKIGDDAFNNIFNPFFTTKSEEKGTGLGLLIVQQIIKSMGGEVTVKNRDADHHTVDFILKLPVNQDPKDNCYLNNQNGEKIER